MSPTQQDRSEATRATLIAAARRLFTADGYPAVGIEAIVRDAGVTRGALYHQFADKTELFAAVLETVDAEVTERLGAILAAPPSGTDTASATGLLFVGIDAWLEACADPEVQRILLVDGPSVLGWARWREIGMRYGIGLVEAALGGAMADGAIPPLPLRPLAHVLVAALEEAALFVAAADDPDEARGAVSEVLHHVVAGLIVGPRGSQGP